MEHRHLNNATPLSLVIITRNPSMVAAAYAAKKMGVSFLGFCETGAVLLDKRCYRPFLAPEVWQSLVVAHIGDASTIGSLAKSFVRLEEAVA